MSTGTAHGRIWGDRAVRSMNKNQLRTSVTVDDEIYAIDGTVNKLNILKIDCGKMKGICRRLSGTVKCFEE